MQSLKTQIQETNPRFLPDLEFSQGLKIWVAAPHPDDFDAIAVTLKFFHDRNDEIHVSVMTGAYSGVEDSFFTPPSPEMKAKIRELEQKQSCKFFGLPEENLCFMRLSEDNDGDLINNQENYGKLEAEFLRISPNLIFMPHGNDTNPSHIRAYKMVKQIVEKSGKPVALFLNRDPKTISLRHDVVTGFSDTEAEWKAELLRCHKSQHQRNLNTRGHGFDTRILKVNQAIAEDIPEATQTYAEAFELEFPSL